MTPLDELVERAAGLAQSGQRRLLGIAGPPGAGKSTLAEAVVSRLGARAVLVPMDGFHLADDVLHALGRHGRKGAADTFDAEGYVALLRRLAPQVDEIVYAPVFRRDRELAEAGALPVHRDVPLVVTEGNYLLADGGFAPVRDVLDECWFVDVDPVVRRDRLVGRHVRHGRSPAAAVAWVEQTDEPNALAIDGTRDRADLLVQLP